MAEQAPKPGDKQRYILGLILAVAALMPAVVWLALLAAERDTLGGGWGSPAEMAATLLVVLLVVALGVVGVVAFQLSRYFKARYRFKPITGITDLHSTSFADHTELRPGDLAPVEYMAQDPSLSQLEGMRMPPSIQTRSFSPLARSHSCSCPRLASMCLVAAAIHPRVAHRGRVGRHGDRVAVGEALCSARSSIVSWVSSNALHSTHLSM